MLRSSLLLTAFALACALPVAAQSPYPQSDWPQAGQANPYTPPAPLTDADLLAQELRSLTADPTNLYALVNAARLSLKLGDTDGAAALYTRADKVAPGNPQVKAGMARLLVNAQRPGEALRLFREAAQAGATERDFGADRALAYDLIGEQERAQREYRALLRQAPDDETTRRYALSLGISGLREPALALLEPLNRRSDRGAWRARAFVLAMNADRAGAERIAVTMMPPGMAEGLRPFFDRLPKLPATDRAFAVHFGEVRGNAARYADARRAPSLPALSPEPNPFPPTARTPVQLAAADTGRRKSRRDKRGSAATRTATAASYATPLPLPPAPTAVQLAALGSTRLAPPPEAFGARAPASASRGVTVLPPPADAYRPREQQLALNQPPPALVRVVPATTAPVAIDDASGDDAVEAEATLAPPVAAGARGTAVPVTSLPLVAAATVAATPAPLVTTTIPPPVPSGGNAAIASFQLPASTVAAATPPPAAVAIGTPPPPAGAQGDTVLAAIMAGITVPDEEKAVPAAVLPRGPAPIGQSKLLATIEKKAETAAERRAAEAKLPPKDARGRYLDAAGKPLLDRRGRPMDATAAAAWKLAEDAKVPRRDARGRFLDAKGKPLLDARGRPLDARAAVAKLADADDEKLPRRDGRGRFLDAKGKPLLDARGRPLDAKAAVAKLAGDAKKPEPAAKGEPSRFWVQVAGGANEDTLVKEWKRVSGAAPALKGKTGWTTPLRATNRVLTGPFKTSAEAMATVNTLKKQGVAAFMFTSEAGQKVTRLGAN